VKTILKVTLDEMASESIKPMPRGAVIRKVGEQHQMIVVWFETDYDLMDRTDGENVEQRRFSIRGTGQPLPEDGVYLGTVKVGLTEWHVFDRGAA
jgi:hypothetical protein